METPREAHARELAEAGSLSISGHFDPDDVNGDAVGKMEEADADDVHPSWDAVSPAKQAAVREWAANHGVAPSELLFVDGRPFLMPEPLRRRTMTQTVPNLPSLDMIDDVAAYVAERLATIEADAGMVRPAFDPAAWLRAPQVPPRALPALVSYVWHALAAYEWAQSANVGAVDAYYRHDEKTADVEGSAAEDLKATGMSATEAAKRWKTHPAAVAHLATRGTLAAAKSDAERLLGVARRRHTSALAMLMACAEDPDALGSELATLADPSKPDSDGR